MRLRRAHAVSAGLEEIGTAGVSRTHKSKIRSLASVFRRQRHGSCFWIRTRVLQVMSQLLWASKLSSQSWLWVVELHRCTTSLRYERNVTLVYLPAKITSNKYEAYAREAS